MVESAAWMLAGAAALALLGFAWLALAMDAHWEQVHGQQGLAPAGPKLLRFGGGALLVASLGLCLMSDHASMAVLVWLMLLASAAVLVAMTLAWRPHFLRPLWPGRRLNCQPHGL